MWVRGLKHLCSFVIVLLYGSHPVWVRGLKQIVNNFDAEGIIVAPRVGAWIETDQFAGNLDGVFNVYKGRTPCGCVD